LVDLVYRLSIFSTSDWASSTATLAPRELLIDEEMESMKVFDLSFWRKAVVGKDPNSRPAFRHEEERNNAKYTAFTHRGATYT
jgi:hypothetical protein